MNMQSRDEFTKKTKDILAKRTGYKCSNPDCRATTVGANHGDDKYHSIGKAAHIAAASENGPRFDKNMTPQQRKSPENGIWLCGPCHDKVDSDHYYYIKEKLLEWKKRAESDSSKEVGQKLSGQADAVNQLTMALTGLGSSFIPSAVSNVHSAIKKVLEGMDKKFEIQTEYDGHRTLISLAANQNVPLNLSFKRRHEDHFESFKRLVENGEDFQVSTEDVIFTGSRLFEEIVKGQVGQITLSAEKIAATVRVFAKHRKSGEKVSFYDINGDIQLGGKKFKFCGSACDELFQLSLTRAIAAEDKNVDFNLLINATLWEGKDIRYLPYLPRFYEFFSCLTDGYDLFVTMELEGLDVLSAGFGEDDKPIRFNDIYYMLSYINLCSTVAKRLNVFVPYPLKYEYSQDDFSRIENVLKILDGEVKFSKNEVLKNPRITVSFPSDNFETALTQMRNSNSIKLAPPDQEYLFVFNKKILLPPKSYCFYNHKINLVKKVKERDEWFACDIEIVRTDSFYCELMYEDIRDGLIVS
jgi:hypothetical protein